MNAAVPSVSAQLIHNLGVSAQFVDAGAFSIDREAAAGRKASYQYGDRRRYLLPLVEGALGLGAASVSLETGRTGLSICAHGLRLSTPMLTLAGLCDPAQVATRQRAPKLARLAVALDMALGLADVEAVRISYSDGAATMCAVYRSPGVAPVILEPVVGELGLHIELLRSSSWSWRGASERAELELLRAALRFSSRLVRLDGHLVSGAKRTCDYAYESSGPGFRVMGGLLRAGQAPSTIELWSAGVCVETRAGEGHGHVAVIELDAPRYDLSEAKIVTDATLSRALELAGQMRRRALVQLERDDERWWLYPHVQRPSWWPDARVARALGRAPRRIAPAIEPELRLYERHPWLWGAISTRLLFVFAFALGALGMTGGGLGVLSLFLAFVVLARAVNYFTGDGRSLLIYVVAEIVWLVGLCMGGLT